MISQAERNGRKDADLKFIAQVAMILLAANAIEHGADRDDLGPPSWIPPNAALSGTAKCGRPTADEGSETTLHANETLGLCGAGIGQTQINAESYERPIAIIWSATEAFERQMRTKKGSAIDTSLERFDTWSNPEYRVCLMLLFCLVLLCLAIRTHIQEKRRAKARQFVAELVRQENNQGRKGRATRHHSRALEGGSAAARARRERRTTQREFRAKKRAVVEEQPCHDSKARQLVGNTAAHHSNVREEQVVGDTAKVAHHSNCREEHRLHSNQKEPETKGQRVQATSKLNATVSTSSCKQIAAMRPPNELPREDSAVSSDGAESNSRGVGGHCQSNNNNREVLPVDNEEQRSEACVICLDSPSSHAFVPCGHLCVCLSCAAMVMRSDSRECPMCRTTPQSAMRVYVIS